MFESRSTALSDAIDEAIDDKGYAWVVGVLEGALHDRWTAERTAEWIREQP